MLSRFSTWTSQSLSREKPPKLPALLPTLRLGLGGQECKPVCPSGGIDPWTFRSPSQHCLTSMCQIRMYCKMYYFSAVYQAKHTILRPLPCCWPPPRCGPLPRCGSPPPLASPLAGGGHKTLALGCAALAGPAALPCCFLFRAFRRLGLLGSLGNLGSCVLAICRSPGHCRRHCRSGAPVSFCRLPDWQMRRMRGLRHSNE